LEPLRKRWRPNPPLESRWRPDLGREEVGARSTGGNEGARVPADLELRRHGQKEEGAPPLWERGEGTRVMLPAEEEGEVGHHRERCGALLPARGERGVRLHGRRV